MAPLARPIAREESLPDGRVEFNVVGLRFSCRAGRAAEDPGGPDGGDEDPVVRGVSIEECLPHFGLGGSGFHARHSTSSEKPVSTEN